MPLRKPFSGHQGKPSASRMLAEEQARLRAERGWSYRELSQKVRFDHTYLHEMETGKTLGSPEVIRALDEVYGTGPHLSQLRELARDSAFRDKYQRYMQLSGQARVMHKYSVSVVPGLLQTEAYARELLLAAQPMGGDVEDQVAARLGRQERLFGKEPTDFRAILDEAVLHRQLSRAGDWHAQLGHLLEMARRPNVTIQVLTFSVGIHGLTNTDTMLMWMPNGRPIGYVETGYSGDLTEDPPSFERLRLAYDRLRDLALSPPASVAFIEQLMEDIPCVPTEPT
ncbi:helix-turn-helix domain-containing protein [Streptomyces xiamenensis]|uniref:helix-turn-helix domain-containing protein n=1 Tax=Streptomyces sp. XC 2026 TaxID=2782004 RepID=UPI0019067069|nr:helix-turn-helix transcriptional regulator [Streptomyces sp. XC 2026]QQN77870.1 helix-turn-helix domain-containing protein [Streptomyces sp. XC 2026]